jgi:hypothetical protein
MARPPHQPDTTSRRTVETMAAYGVPEANIAKAVKISPKTLRTHYRDELDTGATKANCKVAESLYRKATGDGPQSVTAAIFWLKTRAGWKQASDDKPDKDRDVPQITKIERVFIHSKKPDEQPGAPTHH